VENQFDQFQQQEENVDVKVLLFKVLRYWYLFVLSVFTALVVAYFVNKYTIPNYTVNTLLLITDDSWNNRNARDNFMPGFELFAGYKNFENEFAILESRSMREEAYQRLDLDVTYYEEDGFISIEKYTTLYPQLQKYVPFYRKKSVVVPLEIFQNNSLYQDVNRRFSI